MSKEVLQAVGDDSIAFGDQCYWVAEAVKKFLPNFEPGQEVDVTVKDIDGTAMVTFLKKSGVAAPQGNKPQYPPRPTATPPKPASSPTSHPPSIGGLKGDINLLAASIIVAYSLDVELVKAVAKQLSLN